MTVAVMPGPQPVTTGPQHEHVPGLLAMRGFAALGVFFFHSLWRTPALRPLAPVLGHLDIGVEFFFVLSGFLVARPLFLRAVLRGGPVAAGGFWRKRFARIWPAYLVALAGAVAVGVGEIDGPVGLLKHVLLIQDQFLDQGGTGLRVSWTLVVEVAFYAALPLVVLLAKAHRRPHDAWVALCVGLFALGSYAILVTSYEHTAAPYRVLPPYLPAFVAGMLLAAAEAHAGPGTWSAPIITGVRRLAARPLLCFGLAAGLFLAMVALVPAHPTVPAVEIGRDRAVQSFVQVAVAFLVLAPLALCTTNARRLEGRVPTFLGLVSYGFYLWHIQALRLVRPMLEGSALTAYAGLTIALVGAGLAGEASRRIIEDPARRILLGGRGRR